KKSVGKRSKYDAIVSANLITQKDLEAALKKAADAGETVETILMDEYNIPLAEIGKCYAYYFRTDYVGFDKELPIPVDLIHDFTLEKLKSEQWVPLDKKENSVEVAMEDPRDIVKRDNIQLQFKSSTVKFSVTTRDDLTKIVDHFYGISDSVDQAPEDVDDILDELKSEMGEVSEKEKMREELSEDDSAIVRLVNQIIEQAYARQASDIHIEPYAEKDTIVRFRVDGQCSQVMKVPRHYKNALSSRIKIMSNLDIAEKRMPQDGKIKFKHFGRLDIELRVAVIPTVGGNEDIVLRILSSSKAIPLDKLGMSEENLSGFKEILAKPYGICLVVGPTGSGKTTTLHSALGYINTPERKIWTVEDPVEITQYQLRQVQMLPKIGLTFSRAMRAFLRGDPDVIMVGEMRDEETAKIGFDAVQAGRMVLSTLHTNDSVSSISRLLALNINRIQVASCLTCVLAQRLVRK
ncbi:MAG: Flp pilus assembly complex ATPase component TadA, partial [Planctomycetes bacterium]|nr:Flp pilus assembly complex ATPase component TadA [Planctomycetota bacterium]